MLCAASTAFIPIIYLSNSDTEHSGLRLERVMHDGALSIPKSRQETGRYWLFLFHDRQEILTSFWVFDSFLMLVTPRLRDNWTRS